MSEDSSLSEMYVHESSQINQNSRSPAADSDDTQQYRFKPPSKKRKDSGGTTELDDALEKFLSSCTEDAKSDEYDSFATSVAAQLRKMPEMNAIQFMVSIQHQLGELRLGLLEKQIIVIIV